MVLSKIATLSTILASVSLVAGHGYVSSIVANGQKYVYLTFKLSDTPLPIIQLHRLHR
jgi:hypothetical protein